MSRMLALVFLFTVTLLPSLVLAGHAGAEPPGTVKGSGRADGAAIAQRKGIALPVKHGDVSAFRVALHGDIAPGEFWRWREGRRYKLDEYEKAFAAEERDRMFAKPGTIPMVPSCQLQVRHVSEDKSIAPFRSGTAYQLVVMTEPSFRPGTLTSASYGLRDANGRVQAILHFTRLPQGTTPSTEDLLGCFGMRGASFEVPGAGASK